MAGAALVGRRVVERDVDVLRSCKDFRFYSDMGAEE